MGFIDWINNSEVAIEWKNRIMMGVCVATLLGACVLGSYLNDEYKNTGDTNTYLKEEICFADEVFVSVDSLNITVEDSYSPSIDEDGDALSN